MAREEAWRGGDDSRPENGGGQDDAGDARRDWHRRRDAARGHFAAVPPHRIAFEPDGKVSPSRKRYEFRDDDDPANAALWDVLPRHDDLEEAERRLRHVTSPPVHYDARGRQVPGPPPEEERYGVPDDDED